MQAHENLGDLDDQPTQINGTSAYWAKRFPRTVAKNPNAFKFEQVKKDNKVQEDLIRAVAKAHKPERKKKVAPPKIEKIEDDLKNQAKKLENDVFKMLRLPGRKSIHDVVMVTAYVLDMTPANLVLKSRKAHVVLAKTIVSLICRNIGYSASEISRQMGYSDHTTVLHHLKISKNKANVKFFAKKIARMMGVSLGDLN